MSEIAHTPEPWSYCDGGIFGPWDDKADENPPIALIENCGMNGPHTDLGFANARRIVACVNACRGIETNLIEQITYAVVSRNPVHEALYGAQKLTRERNELETKLREAEQEIAYLNSRLNGGVR